ncbi:MAG: DUF2306 domain-containing protein [Pseudomonadota bacterium]
MAHEQRARLRSAARRSWVRDMLMILTAVLAGAFGLYAISRGAGGVTGLDRKTSWLWDASARSATSAIYGHMVLGGMVTALAPLQAVGWIRSRVPTVHRWFGYGIATLAAATALGGLTYIALRGTVGGTPMSVAFTLYGLLMLIAAVQTLRHARAGWPTHRDWALRLIVLILGSWLYRVHYGLWYMSTGGLATNDQFTGAFDLVTLYAFYLPYLAVLELWLWWRPSNRAEPTAIA